MQQTDSVWLHLQRDIDGRTYYEFEFATKANTYIRHALAVVTVANGNTFFTYTTYADPQY